MPSGSASDPYLAEPHRRWARSYADALKEGLHPQQASEEDIYFAANDLEQYMQRRHDMSRPVVLPDGRTVPRMPQTDLWLIKDDIFLGMASLRPQLNDVLQQRGGNIGYAVRESQRKKGYGRLILTLALPRLKELNLSQALVTCHDKNTASIRIIESCGGVLENKVRIPGLDVPERRYWIAL